MGKVTIEHVHVETENSFAVVAAALEAQMYDTPSSLFGQFGDANVTEVAEMLDRELEQLVAAAIQ